MQHARPRVAILTGSVETEEDSEPEARSASSAVLGACCISSELEELPPSLGEFKPSEYCSAATTGSSILRNSPWLVARLAARVHVQPFC